MEQRRSEEIAIGPIRCGLFPQECCPPVHRRRDCLVRAENNGQSLPETSAARFVGNQERWNCWPRHRFRNLSAAHLSVRGFAQSFEQARLTPSPSIVSSLHQHTAFHPGTLLVAPSASLAVALTPRCELGLGTRRVLKPLITKGGKTKPRAARVHKWTHSLVADEKKPTQRPRSFLPGLKAKTLACRTLQL